MTYNEKLNIYTQTDKRFFSDLTGLINRLSMTRSVYNFGRNCTGPLTSDAPRIPE